MRIKRPGPPGTVYKLWPPRCLIQHVLNYSPGARGAGVNSEIFNLKIMCCIAAGLGCSCRTASSSPPSACRRSTRSARSRAPGSSPCGGSRSRTTRSRPCPAPSASCTPARASRTPCAERERRRGAGGEGEGGGGPVRGQASEVSPSPRGEGWRGERGGAATVGLHHIGVCRPFKLPHLRNEPLVLRGARLDRHVEGLGHA